MKKIAIIGCGCMGGALARGIAGGTKIQAADLTVSDPSQAALDALRNEYPEVNVTTDNRHAVAGADLVFIVVKPWLVPSVVEGIASAIDTETQALAFVVGGMKLSDIGDFWPKERELPASYCVIPNTAISLHESTTFYCSARTSREQDARLGEILGELGLAMHVEERLMIPGTALASCGIAYAMRYVRAATEGGVQLGFYAKDACKIVMQTMRGAVALLEADGSHPEAEIDKVTTPGGMTIRGLNAMEAAGFTNAVIAGLIASSK